MRLEIPLPPFPPISVIFDFPAANMSFDVVLECAPSHIMAAFPTAVFVTLKLTLAKNNKVAVTCLQRLSSAQNFNVGLLQMQNL